MTYAMHERLTRDNLRGIWAAITTPFDAHDRFDADVFRENIRRLHAAGAHGIYTTDSDGEFYAIELDEFKQIVAVFAEETRRLNFPTMVGVTWTNTKGMLDRIEYAAAQGILGAHIGHPYFMPMTAESYRAFWQDIRGAAPDWFGLIHYNTPRVHNYRRGPDYVELLDIPNFIGTKHVGSDFPEFMTLMACAPQVAHFTGEHAMTPYMLFGARGVYSWFVNFNPRYMLDWHADIVNQRWEQAKHRQQRMHAFITQIRAVLEDGGNLHGIIGKAVSASSPFLVPANRTRRPYLRIADERVDAFRQIVETQFADMLWQG
ncbi:MAG: dihydrodipicolinate synthase family protein [Chloroflexi bacterium]|nr:dihydrodipicolinate synthase family protein [Chloroflexota bacterium]